uniref:Uncharacterized protein n=1 Tax=Physcomitrium patens TaxID=3218 RepID=A0A7I4CAP4_PHYPA
MVVRVWGEACCGGESSSSGMIRQCRGVEWREEVFGRGEQYCGGEEMVAFGVYPVGSQLPALICRMRGLPWTTGCFALNASNWRS